MKGKKKNSKKEEARTEAPKTEEVKTETPKTEEPKTEQVARDYKKEIDDIMPMVKFKDGEGVEVARLLYVNDRSVTVRIGTREHRIINFSKVITVASEPTSLSFG